MVLNQENSLVEIISLLLVLRRYDLVGFTKDLVLHQVTQSTLMESTRSIQLLLNDISKINQSWHGYSSQFQPQSRLSSKY
jgi:hypothetical protein